MSLRPAHAPSAQACFSACPSLKRQCLPPSLTHSIVQRQTRSFHASPQHQKRTQLRRKMAEWFAGPGKQFRNPLPGSTNYLSAYNKSGQLIRMKRTDYTDRSSEDAIAQKEMAEGMSAGEQAERASERAAARKREADSRYGLPPETIGDLRPFPGNHFFRSESVLSPEMREEIYQSVAVKKIDVSTVSSIYGVDMRRVAAVTRLKTIEKQWEQEGTKLAIPYQKAVLAMLPQTPFRGSDGNIVRHESINDLPVHPSTRAQIFHPTSESRSFTRKDAARVFSPTLLPADERIPHPELVELERWTLAGIDKQQRLRKMSQRDAQKTKEREGREAKQKAWEERSQRVVSGRRWDFKFQDISVEDAGADGRGPNATGLRYGWAHNDRKRGLAKIPTSVE